MFDELNFIVAVDDYPNIGGDAARAISWIESICGGKEYNVRVVDNIKIRESRVILEDLVPMIEKKEDSLVFLAHSKGITDVSMQHRNIYSILRWVIAMYHYSLTYAGEAELELRNKAMFGSLLTHWNNENDANVKSHDMFYIGNFYWVNPKNIHIRSKEEFDRMKTSRFLHENFPLLLDRDALASHNNIYTENYIADLYHMENGDWLNYLSHYGGENMVYGLQNEIIKKAIEE